MAGNAPASIGQPRDPDTFPLRDFERHWLSGSVQPQCIRHALERLSVIGNLVFQGMAHTLLQVRRKHGRLYGSKPRYSKTGR